jgi:hypothetical protein
MINLGRYIKAEIVVCQPEFGNMFLSYFESGWFDGIYPVTKLSDTVAR